MSNQIQDLMMLKRHFLYQVFNQDVTAGIAARIETRVKNEAGTISARKHI